MGFDSVLAYSVQQKHTKRTDHHNPRLCPTPLSQHTGMFRRLQDRLSAAVFGDSADLERLQALGFSEDQARNALSACDGNPDRAAEWLLLQQTSAYPRTEPSSTYSNQENEDLRRAMEQSRIDEEKRQQRVISAASRKAGAAALARHEKPRPKAKSKSPIRNTTTPVRDSATTTRSNNIQLVPKLTDKTIEQQLLRTAQRLQTHPAAVDVLHQSLSALRRDPHNPRYLTIDTTSKRFQRDVHNATGAADFLRAVGYYQDGPRWRMSQAVVDPARIYVAVGALEQAQQSETYQQARSEQQVERDIAAQLALASSTTPQKLPPEPPVGGTRITVKLTPETTLERRFDGDDTVANLVDWLSQSVPNVREKFAQGEWCLLDVNCNAAVSVADTMTLQAAGLWPSGRLAIRPVAVQTGVRPALPSRGLGDAAGVER